MLGGGWDPRFRQSHRLQGRNEMGTVSPPRVPRCTVIIPGQAKSVVRAAARRIRFVRMALLEHRDDERKSGDEDGKQRRQYTSRCAIRGSIGVIRQNHTDYRKEPEAKVGEGASTAVRFWKKAESCGRHLHLWAGHHLTP